MPKIQRPAALPKGTELSRHYAVEAKLRCAEGRMYYLINDHRPDQQTKFCFECASQDSPSNSTHCVSCESPFNIRRFALSARWEQHRIQGFEELFKRTNTEEHQDLFYHPVLVPPFDHFFHRNLFLIVHEWETDHEFLLDVAAPLSRNELLHFAQRMLGLFAHFHQHGVTLTDIGIHNFVRAKNNEEGEQDPESQQSEFLFFDPVIRKLFPGRVPDVECGEELSQFAGVLLRFVDIQDDEFIHCLEAAVNGSYRTPYEMGRQIEQLFNVASTNSRGAHINKNLAAISDVGLVRNLNEDNWGWAELSAHSHLYVVADGMGGHDKGEVASQMAVNVLCKQAHATVNNDITLTIEELEEILATSFQEANNSIKEHSERQGSDMGTTMVTALVHQNNTVLIANVGDSRAYLQREGALHQISKDHSFVQKLVDNQQLTPEEARHHQYSNILMRTVGTERNVKIDLFRLDVMSNDVLLLCTDGLWGEVEDNDMQEIINNNEGLSAATVELMQAAHLGGGKDNVTHILVRIP